MGRMKFGKMAMISALLVLAAVGVVPVTGAAIFNQQEGLLCSDEVIGISFGNYVGEWTVGEVARVSDLAVVGEPGTGTFVKHTVSGAPCGTLGDPAILSFLLDFEVEEYVMGTGPEHITLLLPADRENGSPVIQSGVPELVPGDKYLLILAEEDSGYDLERFGPAHYRFSEFPHSRWVITGDVAVKDQGWRPEQVMSVQSLRDSIANACDSQIHLGNEKVVMDHQNCPSPGEPQR